MRYLISQGLLRHPLEVEIDGVPPCLFCGDPVTRPSMDGPLVCGTCDCGNNRDGSKWTKAQAEERYAHRRSKVAEYRALMIDRRVHEAKDLLAKMTPAPWIARKTYVETASCLADVCDRDDAAFMALARALVPDLIERDALRGAEVAKCADACGVAKGQIATLRETLRAAVDRLRPEVREVRAVIDDPRRTIAGANRLDYEARALPRLLAVVPALLELCEEVTRLASATPHEDATIDATEPSAAIEWRDDIQIVRSIANDSDRWVTFPIKPHKKDA